MTLCAWPLIAMTVGGSFKVSSQRITRANKDAIFGDDVFREGVADDELNTTIDWRDTSEDAYDGQQCVEVDLDEFCKWKKASAISAAHSQ